MQVPEVNFNCRQKTDLMNTSSHNKSDADVGLLVACKVQLSSEVIRWKTESLRLQKECNIAQQKGKELDQTVSKLLEKTKELETQLFQAKEENKHLRIRNVLVDDTKTGSMQRLSQSLNKYNSFPTATSVTNPCLSRFLGHSIPDSRQEEMAVRQVSQEMFEQMKREMKELQEMNSSFVFDQPTKNNEGDQSDCKEELEESLSTLVSDASSLKHHLLEQRKKLNSLIRDFSKDIAMKDSISAKRRDLDSHKPEKCTASTIKVEASSQNVLRENLVEPLHDISDVHVVRKPMNVWNFDDDLTIQGNRNEGYCILEETNSPVQEKVCPLCYLKFGQKTPQDVFEAHVHAHLNEKSESYLDDFIVL